MDFRTIFTVSFSMHILVITVNYSGNDENSFSAVFSVNYDYFNTHLTSTLIVNMDLLKTIRK